jgi:TolA-binding protein
VELQRDISLLQDAVRSMQAAQNEKLGQLDVLIRQAIDAATKANTAVATLQTSVNDRLNEQNKAIGANVAGVGAKVDQMADEFRSVREAMTDLNNRMGKLDLKLADISNAQRAITAPSVPPPGGSNPAGGSTGIPSGTAPSANATWENALRDYNGGNLDLALQEFQEYLKWFRQTDLAPTAQFYIGQIYLRQRDFQNAIKAFDDVLEKFSDNNKTADAHFYKGQALLGAEQKTAAGKEFCEVVRKYPTSDAASKAKSALKGLGLSPGCGVAASAPAKRRRR